MFQSYIDLYNQHREEVHARSHFVFNSRREQALLGLKNAKFATESYRHAPIEKQYSVDYGLNINRIKLTSENGVVSSFDETYFVYIMGDQILSIPQKLQEGLTITSLLNATSSQIDILRPYLSHFTSTDLSNPNLALHALFVQDALFIHVRHHTVISIPIEVFAAPSSSNALFSPLQVVVVLEEGSSLQVISHQKSQESLAPVFLSSVIHLDVHSSAHLDFCYVERFNASTTHHASVNLSQASDSEVRFHTLSLSGYFIRHDINVNVLGVRAQTSIYGLSIAHSSETMDNHVHLYHKEPQCTSRQLFQYILHDQSHCVFSDRVRVNKGAYLTDARQINRNLCLSSDAHIYTDPQLEIYNDDVKCTHGATTGQLDEDALFYLRSRGIGIHQARQLLLASFARQILDTIQILPAVSVVAGWVDQTLQTPHSPCRSCQGCK